MSLWATTRHWQWFWCSLKCFKCSCLTTLTGLQDYTVPEKVHMVLLHSFISVKTVSVRSQTQTPASTGPVKKYKWFHWTRMTHWQHILIKSLGLVVGGNVNIKLNSLLEGLSMTNRFHWLGSMLFTKIHTAFINLIEQCIVVCIFSWEKRRAHVLFKECTRKPYIRNVQWSSLVWV